jgi:hypothetical protein
MYGKIYEQTFTGSMCGKGPVLFAVWAYVLANTKPDHMVELNPRIIATVVGCKESEVVKAIEFFCSTDKDSRNPHHDGKKLLPQGQYLYFVTGHQHFNELRNETARREYMRNYMRQRRKEVNNRARRKRGI